MLLELSVKLSRIGIQGIRQGTSEPRLVVAKKHQRNRVTDALQSLDELRQILI